MMLGFQIIRKLCRKQIFYNFFTFSFPFSTMKTSQLIYHKPQASQVTLDLSLLDHPGTQPLFDCLIILNNGKFDSWMLKKFIEKSKYIIATDGGANHLYQSPFRDAPQLHTIIGDLDSLRPDIQKYYEQRKVIVTKINDQDTNDFEKSLILADKMQLKSIVSFGTLGGRIDQELCNLNSLEKYSQLQPQRFIALGQNSLMFLIRGGEQAIIKVGKHCILNQTGIFCFGKSKVDTQGFKWNLSAKEGPPLQWGKFISSSNLITRQQVSIKTENHLYFTIELTQLEEKQQQ